MVAQITQRPDYHKAYYTANKDKKRHAAWANRMKRVYGLTEAAYNIMLAAQGYVCAICERPEDRQDLERLAVDHDHKTGKVRGLLCSKCNQGLGQFRDDPEIAASAAHYLLRHRDLH